MLSFQNKIACSWPFLPKIVQFVFHYCQISPLILLGSPTNKSIISRQSTLISHAIITINVFLWLLRTVCSNPLIEINAWRKWHQFLELRHFSDKTVWIAFLHVWFILFYFWFNNFFLSLPIGKQKTTGQLCPIHPKIQKTVV